MKPSTLLGWFTPLVGCAISSRPGRRFWASLWVAPLAVAVADLAAAQESASLTRSDVAAFADSVFARYLREYPEPSLALAVVQVSVLRFEYEGNERRGLTATCRREDGSEHVVAASDVVLPRRSNGARYVAAYRKWLGLEPYPPEVAAGARRRRQHKATSADLDLSGPIELVAVAVKEKAARCRLLGSDRVVTLRAGRLWDVVPGEIAVVRPRRQWSYAGHPYLSGAIESARLDVAALGLVPLRLEDQGTWDPQDHYWSEENEPIEEWARPIIARGPRPEFEMTEEEAKQRFPGGWKAPKPYMRTVPQPK